jgi:ABC-type transport system involved in cytochrome bd biosynthesis fused ATPase/permease subunit
VIGETVLAVTESPSLPSRSNLAIETAGLVKSYGGETRALDGITFAVAPGELFGLLGPNGAGKTTTIRILATLLRATSGTARVAGFDVATHPQEVRKRLGLAMQTPTLDACSTGRETLELAGRLHRMPAAAMRRRTDELLELMGLAAVASRCRAALDRHHGRGPPGRHALGLPPSGALTGAPARLLRPARRAWRSTARVEWSPRWGPSPERTARPTAQFRWAS